MRILTSLLSLIIVCSCITNTVSRNAQDETSYFPNENEMSGIFSYELRNLKEPKLSNLNDKNIEVYRLTSSGFGTGSKVLKIEKTDTEIFLTSISKFKNTKRTKNKISFQDFMKFKENLKKFRVENFPTYLVNPVDDGIQYCLETYDKGNYIVIFRNNPQTGRNTDPKFLEIIDLFYKLKN